MPMTLAERIVDGEPSFARRGKNVAGVQVRQRTCPSLMIVSPFQNQFVSERREPHAIAHAKVVKQERCQRRFERQAPTTLPKCQIYLLPGFTKRAGNSARATYRPLASSVVVL